MGSFIPVGLTGEFNNGTMKAIVVQNHEVLLARIGDEYYAVDNRCPHMGGKLSDGKVEGTVVTCPKHSSQFDLIDGRVVRWLKGTGLISKVGTILKSPRPLNKYRVKIEDDKILIEI